MAGRGWSNGGKRVSNGRGHTGEHGARPTDSKTNGPRIAVSSYRHPDTRVAKSFYRGAHALSSEVGGGRQEYCHRACRCHGPHAILGSVVTMVAR
jgi:hypothetical protein